MRRLSLLGVTGVLALGAFNLAHLLSWAYAGHAESRLGRPDSTRTLAASRYASTLAPWSSTRLALQGWILAERGEIVESAESYARALRWNPADPLLWSEYAQALARNERFEELEHPTLRANALAPASPAVQSAIAAMGFTYWDHGSAALQAQWLLSMRYEHTHNRELFWNTLIARGRVLSYCTGPAMNWKIRHWCESMQRVAEACRQQRRIDDGFALCLRGR